MARPKTKKRASSRKSNSRRRRSVLAYPFIIFTLLCAGVYLINWTLKANGDDVFVTAKVHGPLVTDPAVILKPNNGQHFKKIPIIISGTCPANAAYIEIFRNNFMSGTALCDGSSNFSLTTDLFPGLNDLTAHSFNITDDEGPVSSTVTVYYDAPKPKPAPQTSQNGAGGPAASPLALTTSFIYKGYYVGQKVSWPLRLSGGTAPYAVSVDWGDGSNDLISRSAAGDFNIEHVYTTPGGFKNSYTITAKASDNSGQTASLQFFVIVNVNKDMGLAGDIFGKSPPTLNDNYHWLWAAWPAYIFILLMGLSYILGEREELIILRKNGLIRRH